MPAADASASTLETAPPWPAATGTFGVCRERWSCWVGGAAAPTDRTAAPTARTARFRATGRRIRTSGKRLFAQPSSSPGPRQGGVRVCRTAVAGTLCGLRLEHGFVWDR
ncbi:hypothetical protein SHKM778_33200 [Streptomyces sp. KM77-8]|uniref:Uncharacterized protein n=1 Tax=Streptomyces haneummycinicus TaxID=3074435 RepID=A0AAT9HHY9_9ACTN